MLVGESDIIKKNLRAMKLVHAIYPREVCVLKTNGQVQNVNGIGTIKIDDEVVAVIAGLAATEVEELAV